MQGIESRQRAVARNEAKQSPNSNVEIASQKPLAMTLEDARKHLATSKQMIEKMGYHRRDKEVEALEREMMDHESRESAR